MLELHGHTEAVKAAAFSPDDTGLLTFGEDHTLRAWCAVTGTLLWTEKLQGWPQGVVVSADGRLCGLLIDSNVLHVRSWDGETVGRLEHPDATCAALRSHRGNLAAIGADDGELGLWSVDSGQRLGRVKLDFAVTALAFAAPDTLVAIDGTGAIHRFAVPAAGASG